MIIGCGGGNSSTSTVSTSSEDNSTSPSNLSKNGKAQLGVMSKATVKLYELTNSNQKLLATDVTSSGTSIESIGNFNLFLDKLEDSKFYLYEVSEGEDYDVEDDGIINDIPTINKGKFHLLVQGSTIKTIKMANITVLSEIVYQRVKTFLLAGDNIVIETEIKKAIKDLLAFDVNDDGLIGREDLLRYDPVNDKDKLADKYRTNLGQYLDNILNGIAVEYEPNEESVIAPTVESVSLDIFENLAIGTLVGNVNITSIGDSNITNIKLLGTSSSAFEIDKDGNIKVLVYLDYETKTSYDLSYVASNDAGESNEASLSIRIKNIIENQALDYTKDELGIQAALDNGDNDYVLNQLLNNRSAYTNLSDKAVSTNIAAAYVGKSKYSVFDIVGAINSSDKNRTLNGFMDSIINTDNSIDIINNLKEADKYYSQVIAGLDCNNTSGLSQLEKEGCVSLGLIRLTALSNSIKLLFGGDSTTVSQWANGVDVNSSDDLNGNGVIDEADASACAILYASNPSKSCREGSSYSYRGKVTFSSATQDYNLTLIEVDVGSAVHGYNTFYKLITNKVNNNSPILTSGICSTSFIVSTNVSDGVTLYPCPALDSSKLLMELKSNLELGANIQALFPSGSDTKANVESYIKSITGSKNGTVGLENLSDYLQKS